MSGRLIQIGKRKIIIKASGKTHIKKGIISLTSEIILHDAEN